MNKIMKIILCYKFILLLIFLFPTTNISENQGINNLLSKTFTVEENNNDWATNRGYLDQIRFKIITSDELNVQAVRSGETDIIGEFVDVSLLTNSDLHDPAINLLSTSRRGFGHITFNTEKFPTNIRALRQGMAYSLDKIELQQRALGGAAYPLDSVLSPGLGLWSCEFTESNCSYPGGETYYEARPDKGNITVLNAGFYDIDNDGWREFFTGKTDDWNGELVLTNNQTDTVYGWNGYTQKGKTFAEVAGISERLNINEHGISALKPEYQDLNDWIDNKDYSFELMASGGSIAIDSSIIMTVEALKHLGIQSEASFITFSTLLNDMESGDFNAVFFVYSGMYPNPLFLQTFTSESILNQQRNRWYNSTFDNLYRKIESSPDYTTVLQASYEAQKILWQEQPLVVMYNNRYTSMTRSDQFEGVVNVPGEGAYGYWSMVKMHAKDDFFGSPKYKEWPFGGNLSYGLPQPMGSQNTLWDNNFFTQTVMNLIEEKTALRRPDDLSWGVYQMTKKYSLNSDYNNSELGITHGTRLVWNLYDDINWQDGEKLSVDDFIYSYKLLTPKNFTEEGIVDKTNTTNVPQQFIISPMYSETLQDVIAVRKINDTAMEVISSKGGIFEFDNLQITIYPQHIWSKVDDLLNYENPTPIGTGPYKWLSRQPGEFIILERNKNYKWAPKIFENNPFNDPLQVQGPSYYVINYGTLINLSWVITGGYEGNYVIQDLDTSQTIQQGKWFKFEPIQFEVSQLAIGTHEFQLLIFAVDKNYTKFNFIIQINNDTSSNSNSINTSNYGFDISIFLFLLSLSYILKRKRKK